MPTMVRRFQCVECGDVHESDADAELCCSSGTKQITAVDLWECDGDGCQTTFEDPWSAQACESRHETGEDFSGDVDRMKPAARTIRDIWRAENSGFPR